MAINSDAVGVASNKSAGVSFALVNNAVHLLNSSASLSALALLRFSRLKLYIINIIKYKKLSFYNQAELRG